MSRRRVVPDEMMGRSDGDAPVLDESEGVELMDDPTEELTEESVNEPVVAKTVRKLKDVTVILQEATTMSMAGRTFHRNRPVTVPADQAKAFRESGWFRIV